MTEKTENEKLTQAAVDGDLEMLLDALKQGADVNCRGFIVLASNYIDHEAHRVDPEWTPLLWAVTTIFPKYRIVEALINAGADVNASDEYDMTSIMYAAKDENPFILNLLLSTDAKLDIVNDDGETLFDICSEEGRALIKEEVLKRGRNYK